MKKANKKPKTPPPSSKKFTPSAESMRIFLKRALGMEGCDGFVIMAWDKNRYYVRKDGDAMYIQGFLSFLAQKNLDELNNHTT